MVRPADLQFVWWWDSWRWPGFQWITEEKHFDLAVIYRWCAHLGPLEVRRWTSESERRAMFAARATRTAETKALLMDALHDHAITIDQMSDYYEPKREMAERCAMDLCHPTERVPPLPPAPWTCPYCHRVGMQRAWQPHKCLNGYTKSFRKMRKARA